jgi:hypothetical protein
MSHFRDRSGFYTCEPDNPLLQRTGRAAWQSGIRL